jgi:hypothetical protein
MKTLITAALIAITSTAAMAHSPEYSKTDAYKVGFCTKSINENFDEMYDVLDWNTYINSKEYIADDLNRGEKSAGWWDALGRVVFDPIQKEEAQECVDLIVKLAKEKFDLHK